MVIKASASAEIRLLIDALLGADDTKREAAAARLAVIGSRAVPRLLDAYATTTSNPVRLAILGTLERLTDPRALPLATSALRGDPDVAMAATQVLRSLLDAHEPGAATQALDALVAVTLDEAAPHPLRLAALDALRDLPDHVRGPIAAALGVDADPHRHQAAAREPSQTTAEPRAPAGEPAFSDASAWQEALQGRLPESPGGIAALVPVGAADAPLTSLQKMVDALKIRELAAGEAAGEWASLRGAVHQALALRGSRVALYDLRESLSAASRPLPVSFLAAVHEVGDSSCLEPLAIAYARADAEQEWWRQQVASALRAVMTRERLTRRSAVVKRLASRWPSAVEAAFAGQPPTGPRRRG